MQHRQKIGMQSRRGFLRAAAAGTLGFPMIVRAQTLGENAPSKRITMGIIGCGNQAQEDLKHWLSMEDVQVVAVCDVNRASYGYKTDKQFLGREPIRDLVNGAYAKRTESGTVKGCDMYSDFRDVLARKDIDTVAIITPDHWHAIQTIQAAAAGKDIYCQKPLGLTFRDGQEMIKAVLDTLKANKLKDSYIRLVVSRGTGDLGMDPRKCTGKPAVIIIADKITLYPEKHYKEGLTIVTVPTVRNMPEALNPQIKSLNYLNNILAKIEAVNAGCEEAIMLDALGFVAECTGDNIFIVKNGGLYTPPQCMGTLRGITRDSVIELAKKNRIPVHEHVLTRHEVYISDECFLTGTAAEIIPVVKIDGRVIGSGKPGPTTRKLIGKFHAITAQDGVRYKI
jgi:branched-chain amino acid aminotransferase